MTLLHPLGLLGLLAIPVLVLIYIIKSKYTEQVISSTYLWTLSERFLKRKNPVSRLTGIISLILQILAVIFISIALAHPVFTLPGRANDYCFILDGSGSMNVVQSGKTRFESGKDYISGVISSAADGSTFTLITTGNTTDVVLRQTDDKKAALRGLAGTEAAFVSSDFTQALAVAQNFFDENPACKFYLVTDKNYEIIENAELINVAESVSNYAVSDVNYAFGADGGAVVTGKAFSYGGDASITVRLFVDDGAEAVDSVSVELVRYEGKEFKLECERDDFASLRVEIAQDDDLPLDNKVVMYNARSDAQYKSLIISETPFFLNSALASMGNLQREIVSPDKYNEDMKGYGLYVFENCTPEKMPQDGAVWFINPDKGVDGAGFSRRDTEALNGTVELELNSSTASRVRNLLKGTVKGDATSVKEYVKCGLYRSFITLMSCNGDSVVFAGSNAYGNREVVFAFDMHKSDFALSYNGRVLMHNLIDYTFPVLVDGENAYCGDAISVNVLANCTGIRVETPSGKSEYLDTSDAVSEYELTEVGEYVITATVGNNRQSAKVYSQLPVAERITSVTEASFIISGVPSTQKRDGRYEDMLYAFIILAVIVVADWMVYCYEQYQLR
ncbi:MAG: BatA and WFA domain-containing protein [Clostridia bacterium]|nr:BatA and WFA domain-containing protein [Clostridia bacterium]